MIVHGVEDKVSNCNNAETNSKDIYNDSKKDNEYDSEDNDSENENDEDSEEEDETHWGDINL